MCFNGVAVPFADNVICHMYTKTVINYISTFFMNS